MKDKLIATVTLGFIFSLFFYYKVVNPSEDNIVSAITSTDSVEEFVQEVIEKEIAGYNLISVLLESYITAANNMYAGNHNSYDKLILNLLPDTIDVNKSDLYYRILEICHYIASLSDSQALLIYKKITANEY